MPNATVWNLEDCTEFAQSLSHRPPAILHMTLFGLAGLITSAGLWLAVTEADLVVVASGRIRPALRTNALPGDTPEEATVTAAFAARVVEVHVRPGDQVHRGNPLVRVDTERLDNEIARMRRNVRAGRGELERLQTLIEMLQRQYETARARAAAELEQVESVARRDASDHQAEIRLAQLDCELAGDRRRRMQQLAATHAVAENELVEAAILFRQAEARYEHAQLPLEDGTCRVARLALQLVEHDYAVRFEEHRLERDRRCAELEAAMLELANLELERKHADLFAPTSGIVTDVNVGVGDLLEPGRSAVTIARQHEFRLEVGVPSHEVGLLSVGLPARVRLDAYDSRQYGTLEGKVTFLAPDSNASSEAGPAQTSNYCVHIAIDRPELSPSKFPGQVKLGMTGQADIITGRDSILSMLLHRIRQTISLSAAR